MSLLASDGKEAFEFRRKQRKMKNNFDITKSSKALKVKKIFSCFNLIFKSMKYFDSLSTKNGIPQSQLTQQRRSAMLVNKICPNRKKTKET